MKFKLRDYQERGIELLRQRISAGENKIIFWCQTGGGKGLILAELNRLNLLKEKKVLNVMRRRELVFQTAKNLKKYYNLESSLLMSNEKSFQPGHQTQIASIDTLVRKYKKGELEELLEYDTILVDECHDTTSKSYRTFLNWLDENGKPKTFIGFTATPFKIGKKTHDWWQSCVRPIHAHELKNQGHLVSERIYAPEKIDLSKIAIKLGDYKPDELYKKVTELKIIGDLVASYKKYGQGKAALLFAVNVKHSKLLVETFNAAGITAAHYDSSASSQERENGITQLKEGSIKILCNVNIFSTGIDLPWLELAILARPTRSLVLDLQQRGRLLRPFKICGNCKTEFGGEKNCPRCNGTELFYEKKYATFLDHANSVERHGLTYAVREAELEKVSAPSSCEGIFGEEIFIKQCEKCFLYVAMSKGTCPNCETTFKKRSERTFKKESGELILLNESEYKQRLQEKILEAWELYNLYPRFSKTKKDSAYRKCFREFGLAAFEAIQYPENLKKELLEKKKVGRSVFS